MTLARRLAGLVRVEDVALFAWTVLVVPLIAPPGVDGVAVAEGSDPIGGVLGVVAVLGVIACVLTRRDGGPATYDDLRLTPELFARLPLAGGVVVVAGEAAASLGLGFGDLLAALGVVAIVAGTAVLPRLPVVSAGLRRLLVGPMVLASTNAFVGVVGPFAEDAFDLGSLGPAVAEYGAVAWFLFGLIAAATVAFYVLLVFAPRQVAEPEGTWIAWGVRLLVFFAALFIASGRILVV
jgi:hypothetical protein